MKASYYCAGRFNGRGPMLYIIRFYHNDGTFGSCQCVDENALASELTALRSIGYQIQREAKRGLL
jgi:hypothetical protein